MTRTTWRPSGPLDVVVETVPVTDPEASLYTRYNTWFLVKEAEALTKCPGEWDLQTVAVICVEAVRERPAETAWRRKAGRVLYVSRTQVTDMPEGTIEQLADRTQLRQLSLEFLAMGGSAKIW